MYPSCRIGETHIIISNKLSSMCTQFESVERKYHSILSQYSTKEYYPQVYQVTFHFLDRMKLILVQIVDNDYSDHWDGIT